jgi:transcription antitermination factor NusG
LAEIFHGIDSELQGGSCLSAQNLEPHWYAVYTRANHEKRVANQLAQRLVEHFLPFYDSVRRWKDRKVHLQMPLFPGYVFVRIPLFDRMRTLQIHSVVRLVGFNGYPAALPEEEIRAMQNGLKQGVCARPYPYITVGRRVRVVCGPLAGLQGILLRKKNLARVVVSLDMIKRSVAVEVSLDELQPISGTDLSRELASSF